MESETGHQALSVTSVPSKPDLPPIYTAPAAGKRAAQDRIILQNVFVACYLEEGAATSTALIVTPALAWDVGALTFAGVIIESMDEEQLSSVLQMEVQECLQRSSWIPPGHVT